MLGTWDVPSYGRYGRDAYGMFGLLPIYLKNSGYEVSLFVKNITKFIETSEPISENITRFFNLTDQISIIDQNSISSDVLQDFDIFVVTNINKTLSEKDIIWSYVKNGGSLLVLGDHTNVGEILEPLNDLLKPVDIRFRFDSALPLDTKFQWMNCYKSMYNPISSDISEFNEIQISVGASLDIGFSCQPLIIGTYALSDNGNKLNPEFAYLGDYEYNEGEQVGDVVLAASTYYHAGKVLVFGDTSSFQNSAIPYTNPFIQNIFSWLSSKSSDLTQVIQVILSILFLILAMLSYMLLKQRQLSFAAFPIFLIIILLILFSLNSSIFTKNIIDNTVLIDTTHNERFNFESFTDDSINGMTLSFSRNGYLPLFLRDFSKDEISKSSFIVFNAPTKKFVSNEVDLLKTYMKDGGIVILSTGYDDKDASMPLISEFNLDIEGIPLGNVPYNESEEYENEPRFVDSWPILFDISKSESFYNFTWNIEYNLMVFTPYGDGGLLLISDSQFLLDKNIESIYDYWPGNIIFLKYIIDELTSAGG